jgi:hypothetical protein
MTMDVSVGRMNRGLVEALESDVKDSRLVLIDPNGGMSNTHDLTSLRILGSCCRN